MRNTELSKSVEVRLPNFQKDIIIPQIYNLENIKLIQSCGYRQSPKNNVTILKKKNIHNVITTIINKQRVQTTNKNPLWKTRGAPTRVVEKKQHRQHSKILQNLQKEKLFMEIDEQIGEMIALNEENFSPFAERVKTLLSKVKYQAVDKLLEEKKREVEQFISVISGKAKNKVNPEQTKPIEGLIDEINKMQREGLSRGKIKRAQSAGLIRNSSQIHRNSRLLKSGEGNRSSSNLKKKQGLQQQITKSKGLIKMINQSLETEDRTNKKTESRMRDMRQEWSEKGNLQLTFIRSSNMIITPNSLNILKERRLKSGALARIDNEYMK